MKQELLKHYEDQLNQMQVELKTLDELGQDGQRTVELDQQAVGRLSRMDALQGQAMAKATAARRDQQAKRIDLALQRISSGEFGECLDCGEDMPTGRLDLDPTAALCVSCSSG